MTRFTLYLQYFATGSSQIPDPFTTTKLRPLTWVVTFLYQTTSITKATDPLNMAFKKEFPYDSGFFHDKETQQLRPKRHTLVKVCDTSPRVDDFFISVGEFSKGRKNNWQNMSFL